MRFPFVLVALFLALSASAQAADGDIIVVRGPGADAADVRANAEVRLVKPLGIERTELVEPRDGDVQEALAELRADAEVVLAEADTRVRAGALDDPYFPSLWGLANIFAADAWATAAGAGAGAGITVGIVDTGIEASHADLAAQVTGNPGELGAGRERNGVDDDGNGFVDDYQGWDFVSRDNTPQDGNGHGTHVAGTIAAVGNNGAGVVGVAPNAKVVAVRALDDAGSGYMSGIASAFDYAGKLGLPIVNASLGGGYSRVMESVIAKYPNTLFVVAAGNATVDNDGPNASYPCALPQANVLCVAANDSRDNIAWFSNYGATTVDLSAPGVGIRSTYLGDGYQSLNGTSMAAPHVAGAAALALGARASATSAQLKWALTTSADAVHAFAGKTVTGGRLNVASALVAITGTSVPKPEPAATAPPAQETPTPTPEAPAVTPPPVVAPPVAPPAAPPATSTPAPVSPVVVAPTPTPFAPRLSAVQVGGSLKGTRGKLRVSFALTQPATVRFSVLAEGRPIAIWTRNGRRGGNQYVLTRKLPTGKTLKRGSYTLSVSLSASAKASAALRVR